MDEPIEKRIKLDKGDHHVRKQLCTTRLPYRQGRKLTAVKVYTVNDESLNIVVSGVPDIKIEQEFEAFASKFGDVDSISHLVDYDDEPFVKSYVVKYGNMNAARYAKKQMDTRSYFGSVLHVFYAPEMETVEETRDKLADRRKRVARVNKGVLEKKVS